MLPPDRIGASKSRSDGSLASSQSSALGLLLARYDQLEELWQTFLPSPDAEECEVPLAVATIGVELLLAVLLLARETVD